MSLSGSRRLIGGAKAYIDAEVNASFRSKPLLRWGENRRRRAEATHGEVVAERRAPFLAWSGMLCIQCSRKTPRARPTLRIREPKRLTIALKLPGLTNFPSTRRSL